MSVFSFTVNGTYLDKPLTVTVPPRVTKRWLRRLSYGSLVVLATHWGEGLSRGQTVMSEMRRRDQEAAQ